MNRQHRRSTLARVRATRNEWHPFERVDTDPAWVAQHAERLASYMRRVGDLRAAYRNNIYSVQVFDRGRALQLVVRRHDGGEVLRWSELQRIKNELVGPERAALEVYPAESDVVDQANLRHLFVLPEGSEAPFTIRGRWS